MAPFDGDEMNFFGESGYNCEYTYRKKPQLITTTTKQLEKIYSEPQLITTTTKQLEKIYSEPQLITTATKQLEKLMRNQNN
jgi:hypothetical protein